MQNVGCRHFVNELTLAAVLRYDHMVIMYKDAIRAGDDVHDSGDVVVVMLMMCDRGALMVSGLDMLVMLMSL